jgi:phosphoglucosamine mutase
MGKLFGTDGIRGIVDQEPITRETAFKVGRAVVRFCQKSHSHPTVIIGRDTRLSGETLAHAVGEGIRSMDGEAFSAGVLPTPGVAFLTRKMGKDAGIVISASHNPYEYNGFKIFSHEGFKLSEGAESEIEDLILSDRGEADRKGHGGGFRRLSDGGEQYLSFLRSTVSEGPLFEGKKVVLDCANGATYKIAPRLFQQLGAQVESLGISPDGKNINEACGSQFTQKLQEWVIRSGADVGLAFDGDGDRLIGVDEKGGVLTGDQILLICAKMLKEEGQLESSRVVSTVMSNMGFRIALRDLGIEHIASKVGDRHVMEEMEATGAVMGGEESGHIIFSRHHSTGDGILSALKLLAAMKRFERPLSFLAGLMTLFPQFTLNVPIRRKPDLDSVPELVGMVKKVETGLGDRGRVLVRYSGTEPVCRIMVEGENQSEIEDYARQIGVVVERHLV